MSIYVEIIDTDFLKKDVNGKNVWYIATKSLKVHPQLSPCLSVSLPICLNKVPLYGLL